MGTPNREPQQCGRKIIEYMDPAGYIPIIFLLYSWGSLFGAPIKVPISLSNHPFESTHPPEATRKLSEDADFGGTRGLV